MFYLVGVLLLLFIIFICLYIAKSIQNFSIFKKINNKFLLWVLSILPIIIICLLFGIVNGVVILLHWFVFLLISSLIVYIIEKVKNKKIKYYLCGILSIIFTSTYLLIGVYNCYHISETNYIVKTNKYIGESSFKIIQISDTHIGTTFDGDGFRKEIEKISKIDSDIVVITGDFIDDGTSDEDIIKSCFALSLLKPKYGVYYVYGNHDRGYYSNKGQLLTEELIKNNVNVLVDDIVNINDYIYLIGRNDSSHERKSIGELVDDIDESYYLIDLNHQPTDYDNEKDKVDLVLSGHSHGGQFFPLGYIGKLIKENDEFYGLHKRGNTTFIVNSGMSNWELMFKTFTHSEYGVIEVVYE